MKIGVISDIHSNIVAFKACTKYLEEQGCDEYLLLGDYISDTPYTRETLDYLYELLLTGIDHAADMVSLAAELARKAGDTTPWPNIDDHYFEMASKELGIPEYSSF